jgi:hypothetical protein
MQAHGIAALIVKSADATGGLISEREIVHAISQHGERALSMAVLDVMTRIQNILNAHEHPPVSWGCGQTPPLGLRPVGRRSADRQGRQPDWGLAQLMRPARAAPGVPLVYSRYAGTRACATAIIAALCPGGVMSTFIPDLQIVGAFIPDLQIVGPRRLAVKGISLPHLAPGTR